MTIDITNGGSDSATRQTRLIDAMQLAGGDESKLPSTTKALQIYTKILAGLTDPSNKVFEEDSSIATVTQLGATVDPTLSKFFSARDEPEKFRYSAAIEVVANGIQMRLYTTTTANNNGNIGDEKDQVQTFWEFYTDAEKICLGIRRNSQFTIQIDDIFQNKDFTIVTDDGSNNSYVNVEFPDKRIRKVTLNFNTGASGFGGVNVLDTDNVWASESTLTMAMFGDSFGTGTTTNPAGLAYLPAMAKLMGVSDYQLSAIGGTGVAIGREAGYSDYMFSERVPLDIAHQSFDIVYMSTSTNDNLDNSTETEVVNGFNAWYSAVRQLHPNALIIVGGSPRSVTPRTVNDGGYVEAEQAVLNAANALGDPLVVTVPVLTSDDPPVYGTGNDGNLTGDGNADLCVDADGLHYNDYGHEYDGTWRARRVYAAIKNKMLSL
tara:strand:- start:2721 stop:4022 length:1302 start_codon:yes stop_codon:yes gene_type:complete